MVAKKRKSKRQTLQQKFKIQKRTKEHHKRLKSGKLSGGFTGKKVDNFVPNAWPYKEDLLKEIKTARDKMELVKQKQKDKRQEEMMSRRGLSGSTTMDVERKAVSAAVAVEDTTTDMAGDDGEVHIKTPNLGQNSRRAYLRELRKVVETADVILNVLDARDPLGTRSTAVEDMVLSDHRKKLVYVLNKSDLVPKDVLAGWLMYLRKRHPTVPFKSNTQNQKGNLGRTSGKVSKQTEGGLQTSQAVGADELIGLLKNYCRVGSDGGKAIISVGVVGFPNVGKSSLINSMTRTRAVGVSAMPGFTKVLQEVNLDKNIRLIDSPGIVFADGDSTATALRNCVNVEDMEDVITPVQAILDRCPQAYLMQLYGVPRFKERDCMSFLALVARQTGRLKKGGVPNVDAAARGVIHDWNNGKIKFYCKPPRLGFSATTTGATTASSAASDTKIVSAFSDELDLSRMQADASYDYDVRVLDAIDAMRDGDDTYVGMEEVAGTIDFHIGDSSKGTKGKGKAAKGKDVGDMDQDDDDEEDDEDGEDGEGDDDEDDDGASMATGTGASSAAAKKTGAIKSAAASAAGKARAAFLPDEVAPEVDPRKLQKQLKKKAGKDSRREGNSKGSGKAADYDFDTDFQY